MEKYEKTLEKVIELLETLSKEATEYIFKALVPYGGELEMINSECNYINDRCITYDGGNHPEYAANPFATIYSVEVMKDGKDLLINTSDGPTFLSYLDGLDVATVAECIMFSSWQPKVGDKVKWHDPAINDYPEDEQEEALNRVFEVVLRNGSILILKEVGGCTEVEVDLLDGEIECL